MSIVYTANKGGIKPQGLGIKVVTNMTFRAANLYCRALASTSPDHRQFIGWIGVPETVALQRCLCRKK